jgi:recombination associated protein RdgC
MQIADMWFKNQRAYRLSSPFTLKAEQLADMLSSTPFKPCGKSQPLSLGWVPPLGEGAESLVHAANGRFLLCLRREEKLLPASVVREQLSERIAGIEREQARKVYRKERLQLRDDIVQECLPRAFSRSTHIHAYLDTRRNWLFVDSASAGRAEELVGLLREAVGTLPLLLPRVNHSPAHAMTGWLVHRNLPKDFALEADCDLREPGEAGGVVRCRGVELASEEVDVHLQAGKQVVRLALSWDEKLSLVLGDDLVLRRLRFADELVAENEDISSEDPLARQDADFALMSDVISDLQDRLIEVFGGEAAD